MPFVPIRALRELQNLYTIQYEIFSPPVRLYARRRSQNGHQSRLNVRVRLRG